MERAVKQTTLRSAFGSLTRGLSTSHVKDSPRHEAQALLPRKSAGPTNE